MQPDVMIGGPGIVRGEWVALTATNTMLSTSPPRLFFLSLTLPSPDNRFGARSRPYLTHVAKSLSVPFLHEIHTSWPAHFHNTSLHSFRSPAYADPDVSTTLLQTHYVVERWREALLWSFVVGRVGGDHDVWGQAEMERAWRELGGVRGEESLSIKRAPRATLESMEAFWQGEQGPRVPEGHTTPEFCECASSVLADDN